MILIFWQNLNIFVLMKFEIEILMIKFYVKKIIYMLTQNLEYTKV